MTSLSLIKLKEYARNIPSEWLSTFSVLVLLLLPHPMNAETLKITSTPSGATIELDGVVVGATPYEKKMPGGYFHKPHTVLTARLGHPMVLRVSKEGYTTKELVMTEGPMPAVNLKGTYFGDYYLLKTDHFDVVLEPVSKVFTGTVIATVGTGSKLELRPELSVEDIVQKSKPAVVLLSRPGGQGTGFFITDTGVVATNAHVVRGTQSLTAVLDTGQQVEAKVVYTDPELDIALLKVDGTGFPTLPLADLTTIRQGQTVVAIGNPGAGMPFSVTKGIVSAIGPVPDSGRGTWVQTDAAINPGNSGGPLLNAHGESVGITTLKVVGTGVQSIGFALSSADLIAVLQRFYPAISTPNSGVSQSPEGSGTLTIASEPDSAEVYVDGKFVGNAPATLKLSTGPHTIQLKSLGRTDWERTIEILKDSQLNLKAQMAVAK